MVDVIRCSKSFRKVEEVVHGSKDVGSRQMFDIVSNFGISDDVDDFLRVFLRVDFHYLQNDRISHNTIISRVQRHLVQAVIQIRR
ncbi:hypothetical protein SDC9_85846 [bioreactor metagenome]|uniref:Uncharacterized protein n=1 Tax=bioreactor metagenome TaxID=1076179 RepID=A0A644ZKK2_9ZZZZ